MLVLCVCVFMFVCDHSNSSAWWGLIFSAVTTVMDDTNLEPLQFRLVYTELSKAQHGCYLCTFLFILLYSSCIWFYCCCCGFGRSILFYIVHINYIFYLFSCSVCSTLLFSIRFHSVLYSTVCFVLFYSFPFYISAFTASVFQPPVNGILNVNFSCLLI